MQTELHNMLVRQLKRLGLSTEIKPENQEMWTSLLTKINDAYVDADQDRYLLERSSEIASKKLMELNKELENAHRLTQLGSWKYDIATDNLLFSKALLYLLDLEVYESAPTYQQFLQLIHENDIPVLEDAMKNSQKNKIDFDVEMRVLHKKTGEYRYYRCIGHPHLPENPNEGISTISGVMKDITQRKKSEKEIQELNEQLLVSARRAGMAEVATAILHNIGNVLNSVNVSVNTAQEQMKEMQIEKLVKVSEMLDSNGHNLGEFLVHDAKGKLIPQFLSAFSKKINESYLAIKKEMMSLHDHIVHIKDIIATQQSIAGTKNMVEEVDLAELIESALQISEKSTQIRGIQIQKNMDAHVIIHTDKSKLFQILVNLIQNAKEAVVGTEILNKKIVIILKKELDNQISIIIEDNGIGILPENITRIFSFGFTTKKSGHGFGLHSCAISAKQLGGSLNAESKGAGKGATFKLILPIESKISSIKEMSNE